MAWKLAPDVPDNTDDTLLGHVLNTLAPEGHEPAKQKIKKLFKQNPVTEAVQRTGLRTAARVGEVGFGGTGSVGQLALGAANYVTGGVTPTYEEARKKLPILPPTIENVKEFQEKATGEYLKPKNYLEKKGDELVQLVTSIALPGLGAAGLTSGAKIAHSVSKIPRAAKIASIGIGGSELTKAVTSSEGAGEAVKLGILLGSGIPGGREALEDVAKKSFEKAKSIPKNIVTKVPKLQSFMDSLQKYTETGALTEDKQALQKFMGSVSDSLGKGTKHTWKNGKPVINTAMPVRELVQLEKDANALIRDHSFPKTARPYLIDLKKEITKSLKDYAEVNKPWGKSYLESKDIYYGLNQRSFLNNFLNKVTDVSGLLESKLAKGLLFPASAASYFLSPTGFAGTAAAGAITKGLGKTLELGEFMYKSPTAFKYYRDAMSAAFKENKNAFILNAKKLDKEAQKYEKENPTQDQGKWKLAA